jgi:hypothetical protein
MPTIFFLSFLAYYFLTLSYLSKIIWLFISSDGFSALEKKTAKTCSQKAMLPIQLDVTALYSNGHLEQFEFELALSCMTAPCIK